MGKGKHLDFYARIAIDMSKSKQSLAVIIKEVLLQLNNHCKHSDILLDDNNALHIEKLPLSIGENITLDGFDLDIRFMRHKSPLQDDMVNIDKINTLFEKLSLHDGNLLLNHLGFCYKETDIEEETAKLLEFCRLNKLSLYHETLDGFDPWFFVGTKADKGSPMIEFLPTSIIPPDWVSTKNYWLPQIQIDIDTSHSDEKIKEIHSKVFDEEPKLQQLFVSNGTVVVYRLRLGVLDGVNINLDIGTSARKTDWYRENVLVKVNL